MTLRLDYRAAQVGELGASLAERLERILAAMAASPQSPVADIDILSAEERTRVLVEWNATEQAVPHLCLPALFEAQVARTPDAPALIFGSLTQSYGALDVAANRLAHHLIAHGIGPEDLVAIALPRSPAMVEAVLAVLKSGAAYLPLDPDYPAERLAFMLSDARPAALITTRTLAAALAPAAGSAHRICLDDPALATTLAACPVHAPTDAERTKPLHIQNTAYVIYTSGSSGKPKGVIVTHRNIGNFLAAMQPRLNAGSRVTSAACNLRPSVSILLGLELMNPLLAGGSIVLACKEDSTESISVESATCDIDHGVNVMQATPSFGRPVLDRMLPQLPPLKALVGGEAVS